MPRHPWERSRARFVVDLLRRYSALAAARRVLDVGAGDAWLASQLLREGPPGCRVTCWDVEYRDDTASRLGLADHPRLTLTRERPAERPEDRFDLVLALDVLEHVEDDRALLSVLVAENLLPTGWLLITVPAWQALYTRHDESLQHHRRYSPAMLERLVAAAGLELVGSGGLFHSLLVPRALGKLRELVRPPRPEPDTEPPALTWRWGTLSNNLVYAALRADNAVSMLAARASIAFPGLSVWALCRPS